MTFNGTASIEKNHRTESKINITDLLTAIINEIILRTKIFQHIDMNRIHICLSSNRGGSGAIYGKLVPLKFKGGSDIMKFRGRHYALPKITHNRRDLLYIIYFYSPRFLDLSAAEKLRVIFHELYHISPEFNGDIRRLGRVKASHGSSKKRFDSMFEDELKTFFDHISRSELYKILEMNASSLNRNFKKIYCSRMKIPKPVVID